MIPRPGVAPDHQAVRMAKYSGREEGLSPSQDSGSRSLLLIINPQHLPLDDISPAPFTADPSPSHNHETALHWKALADL